MLLERILRMLSEPAELRETEMNLYLTEALAERVGYASESMFCATFKRTQGITPTEYRKSRKEKEIKP